MPPPIPLPERVAVAFVTEKDLLLHEGPGLIGSQLDFRSLNAQLDNSSFHSLLRRITKVNAPSVPDDPDDSFLHFAIRENRTVRPLPPRAMWDHTVGNHWTSGMRELFPPILIDNQPLIRKHAMLVLERSVPRDSTFLCFKYFDPTTDDMYCFGSGIFKPTDRLSSVVTKVNEMLAIPSGHDLLVFEELTHNSVLPLSDSSKTIQELELETGDILLFQPAANETVGKHFTRNAEGYSRLEKLQFQRMKKNEEHVHFNVAPYQRSATVALRRQLLDLGLTFSATEDAGALATRLGSHKTDQLVQPAKKTVFDHLHSLVCNTEHSDIEFKVCGELIPAHRAILSRSDFFKTLLSGSFKEGQDAEAKRPIEMTDIEVEVFQLVLKHIYTGTDDVLGSDSAVPLVLSLHQAAHKFMLKELQQVCEVHLIRQVAVDNAVCLVLHADLYQLVSLKEAVMELAEADFPAIAVTADYAKLLANPELHAKMVTRSFENAKARDRGSAKRPRIS